MSEIMQHPRLVVEVLAAYWAFSAIVTGMPKPSPNSYWGNWVYDSLHLFAGAVKQFADTRIQTMSTTVVKVDSAPIEKQQ